MLNGIKRKINNEPKFKTTVNSLFFIDKFGYYFNSEKNIIYCLMIYIFVGDKFCLFILFLPAKIDQNR